MILFISFCTITSKTLTSDNFCPSHLSNECLDDFQLLYKSIQVLILFCRSEHLIRYCSLISKPIEFMYNGGSLLIVNTVLVQNKNCYAERTFLYNRRSIEVRNNFQNHKQYPSEYLTRYQPISCYQVPIQIINYSFFAFEIAYSPV